jgi:hypothetical protein
MGDDERYIKGHVLDVICQTKSLERSSIPAWPIQSSFRLEGRRKPSIECHSTLFEALAFQIFWYSSIE